MNDITMYHVNSIRRNMSPSTESNNTLRGKKSKNIKTVTRIVKEPDISFPKLLSTLNINSNNTNALA